MWPVNGGAQSVWPSCPLSFVDFVMVLSPKGRIDFKLPRELKKGSKPTNPSQPLTDQNNVNFLCLLCDIHGNGWFMHSTGKPSLRIQKYSGWKITGLS